MIPVPVDELSVMQEITGWKGFPEGKINHTYVLFKEDKMTFMVAHIPHGSDELRICSQPIPISKTGRKFKKIDMSEDVRRKLLEAS